MGVEIRALGLEAGDGVMNHEQTANHGDFPPPLLKTRRTVGR
jgi:hypothetical protein